MNKSILIGRLTKDPELQGKETKYTKFTIAVDRIGKDKEADFIPVTVFGKQAENAVKYLAKGRKVAIDGHIQSGSYEKDGKKIYTLEVIADRVEYLEWGDKKETPEDSFSAINEEVPY